MKSQFSIKSALFAGFVATTAMTAFTYMAPLMGFEMNIPKMLAATMGTSIILGWIAHYMVGEILAIGFVALFLQKLNKDANAVNGSLFALIPWLMVQVIVMPMMIIMEGGSYIQGFFSGSFMIAMASLVGHLIYGAVLGSVYKVVKPNF